MKIPNFLVIANKRCGTSWINANLKAHPDIFIPKQKGVHFFDKYFDKGLNFYASFFETAKNEKIRGETEHSYFWNDVVPKRIFKTLGHIPLIVSFRQPVDRAYSYYQLINRFNKHVPLPFEQAFYNAMEENNNMFTWGLYGEQLEKYLKYFSLKEFHIIKFEDINAKPKETIQNIYSFLNVESDFEPPLLAHHWTKATNVPFHMNPIMKSVFYTSDFTVFIRKCLKKIYFKNIKIYRKFSPIPLSLEQKKKLTKFYDDDLQKLMQLTNLDFSSWLSNSI